LTDSISATLPITQLIDKLRDARQTEQAHAEILADHFAAPLANILPDHIPLASCGDTTDHNVARTNQFHYQIGFSGTFGGFDNCANQVIYLPHDRLAVYLRPSRLKKSNSPGWVVYSNGS
jgi:hypothetical protein